MTGSVLERENIWKYYVATDFGCQNP